jgi:hypothetical protein
MSTTKESRAKFYESASRQIQLLTKRPRLKRKLLVPMLADLLAGMLLILGEREPGDVKDSKK